MRSTAARVAELDPRRTAVATVAVGVVLGVLVSISSVGAGAIGVVALMLLYPQLPMAKIVGSDIAHAVPLTLIAGIGHWMMGSVDWHIILSLLVGSLPGIFVGSYFAIRVPERALRADPGDDLVRGGKPYRLRSRHRCVVIFHRIHASRGRLIPAAVRLICEQLCAELELSAVSGFVMQLTKPKEFSMNAFSRAPF